MSTQTVNVEVEQTTRQPAPQMLDACAIMVSFLEEARRAPTISDINIAAGVAHQQLVDLLGGKVDCAELFEVPGR